MIYFIQNTELLSAFINNPKLAISQVPTNSRSILYRTSIKLPITQHWRSAIYKHSQ